MNSASGGEDIDPSRRQDVQSDVEIGTTRHPSVRLLLPVANETNAKDTCAAVRPYVDTRRSELVAVHVIEKTPGYPDELPPDAALARAEATCSLVQNHFGDADYRVATEVRYGPNVVEEIIGSAEAIDATAIGFTPRQGRRWTRILTGDVGYKLLTNSHKPVVVFPRSGTNRGPLSEAEGHPPNDLSFDSVVLPIANVRDAEIICRAVLPYLSSESRVVVTHVVRKHPRRTGPRDHALADVRESRAQDALERASEWLGNAGFPTATRLEYAVDVVGAIDEVADEEDADVIAFTPRKVARWKKLLSGDVADKLMRRSSRPVVVVPVKEGDERR